MLGIVSRFLKQKLGYYGCELRKQHIFIHFSLPHAGVLTTYCVSETQSTGHTALNLFGNSHLDGLAITR